MECRWYKAADGNRTIELVCQNNPSSRFFKIIHWKIMPPRKCLALEAQCVCATASRPPAPQVVRTLRRRPKGLSVQVRKTVLCVLCVKSAILDHNNGAMVLWSFWMYQMDQHKCKFTARHAPLHNVCKVLVLLLLNMNLQIGLHYFVQKIIIELQSMSFVF